MTTEQIAGTLVLIAHGIAALGWLIVALKSRQMVSVLLATAFLLLWVPTLVRMFPGETYNLEGRRVLTVSHVISRIAYVSAYLCFAASAITALRLRTGSKSSSS